MKDFDNKTDWGLIAFLLIVLGSGISLVYALVQAAKSIYQLIF